jgi:DNA ligase-1
MRALAGLLDALVFAPQRQAKLRILQRYFREVADPERGYGLAALTGDLRLPQATPSVIRAVAQRRVDPELFALSYDFVGDLAETTALIWPGGVGSGPPPSVSDVVTTLSEAAPGDVPGLIESWLDGLDPSARYALLKLMTGGMRVGVSARLAKTALAEMGGVPLSDIEELWHGLEPPYEALFAWLERRAGPPAPASNVRFRPLMLANPIDADELLSLSADAYFAEWKWDGIRVQIAAGSGARRLFSRTGDDISGSFPDVIDHVRFNAVLDGELLVVRDGVVAPFSDLQRRLGRKVVSPSLVNRFPAHVRLYDMLFDGEEDLRPLPLVQRRQRLEQWWQRTAPRGMDLSPLVPFESWQHLQILRDGARAAGIEGLMLKHKGTAYIAGRPKGPWFKWKRAPLTADCVLMYAQRGHGKRSSYYSDFTFGCWRPSDDGRAQLVPVGKAYFGFTDAELIELDRWVRAHTSQRFGPVRAVEAGLVLEIAFDSVQLSSRHKSGLAMRFPRVHRIRWDKPASEADHVETLAALMGESGL